MTSGLFFGVSTSPSGRRPRSGHRWSRAVESSDLVTARGNRTVSIPYPPRWFRVSPARAGPAGEPWCGARWCAAGDDGPSQQTGIEPFSITQGNQPGPPSLLARERGLSSPVGVRPASLRGGQVRSERNAIREWLGPVGPAAGGDIAKWSVNTRRRIWLLRSGNIGRNNVTPVRHGSAVPEVGPIGEGDAHERAGHSCFTGSG
jgi:hypothetical protein